MALHIDLQETPAGQVFHATVCVVGGGIAGLILATRLAGQGMSVHLLEAGGIEFEQRSQALFKVEMAAGNHSGSHDGRFRTFGGSSTRWGGQILPYTSDIFDPPPGSPSAAWPVRESDLSPYYDEVQAILGVDSMPFTADFLPALGRPAIAPTPDVLVRFSKWTPFNKRNLARTVGAEALAHPGITVFSHANVTSLVCAHGTIQSARVVNYSAAEFTFTATQFVLCAGTVESCRLLLCSPQIPNPHDLIGRYFHDHVAYHAALFHSPGRERALDLFGPFYVDGTIHTCKLEASAALRAREHLYAVMAHVVVIEPEDSGINAIRNMLRSIQSGRVKEAIGSNLLPMLRGAGDVARLFFYSRFKRRRAVSKRAVLRLNIDVEQAPNPDNRIRLSPLHKDALGVPVTVVEWRIGEPEQDTAVRYSYVVKKWLEDAGADPGEWTEAAIEHITPLMIDTYHAMGGLRMGDDASRSVVDRNLLVHGVDNLHVASCAVFPSGSSSNPTFTLMALTLRLADHLVTSLRESEVSAQTQSGHP